jgi:hemerythrin-like metal-binding protein
MTLNTNTQPELISISGAVAKGIRTGEAEHGRIIGLLEKATQAFVRRASAAEVNGILLELNGYTLNHFREEEKLMCSSAFPGLEMHQREHTQLAAHLRGLLDMRSKQEALQCAVGVLSLWVDAHLRITDRYFLEYLQRKVQ